MVMPVDWYRLLKSGPLCKLQRNDGLYPTKAPTIVEVLEKHGLGPSPVGDKTVYGAHTASVLYVNLHQATVGTEAA